MAPKQPLQHPNWCFTLHYGGAGQVSENDATITFWEALCEQAHYAIAGRETAPETGQAHLQGYVQLNDKQRITQLKKLPGGSTVHWEVAKGDERHNIVYCSKEDPQPLIHGDEPRELNPGKRERERWDDVLHAAKRGDFENIDSKTQVVHARSLDYIHTKYRATPKDLDPTQHMNLWIWGPTGTGKSRTAREYFEEHEMSMYYKTQNKWWDNYKDEDGFLIDDLEITNAQHLVVHIKQWFDMYAFQAEHKGGMKMIRPKEGVITSNFHPWDIFGEKEKEWYEPIMRRMRVIYLGPGPAPQKGPAIIEQNREPGTPLKRCDTPFPVAPGAPRKLYVSIPKDVINMTGSETDEDEMSQEE